MSIKATVTVEKLKALGIPASELTEAWNWGNLADSYIPVQETYFKDGQGNIKRLFVEASTEADVDPHDGTQDSFQRHYTLHSGTGVPWSDDAPRETRSIVSKAATGYFQLKGGDVSLRIERAESQPAIPKPAMYLLFFLPKGQREVLYGDITEMYSLRKRELGAFAAYRWLYKQIGLSMWPLVKQVIASLHKWTYRFYR